MYFPAPFDIINDILRGARDLFPDTSETFAWHIRERRTVDSLHDNLDLEILNKAYQCTRNVKAVSVAAVCLLDQDSIPVLDYFTQLNKAAGKCSIRSFPKDELLVYQVLLCASQLNKMKIFTKDCGGAVPASFQQSEATPRRTLVHWLRNPYGCKRLPLGWSTES